MFIIENTHAGVFVALTFCSRMNVPNVVGLYNGFGGAAGMPGLYGR